MRRTSRYSGRYRPACRIIQAGGRSTGRPNGASRNRFADGRADAVLSKLFNIARGLRRHVSDQLPQHERQDAAVPVVVHLDRRVDADA